MSEKLCVVLKRACKPKRMWSYRSTSTGTTARVSSPVGCADATDRVLHLSFNGSLFHTNQEKPLFAYIFFCDFHAIYFCE